MKAERSPGFGVTLAVQGHPPVVNCVQDLIDLVEEVDMDCVKIGLDLPLFDRQDDEYIIETVRKIGKRMVHSHTLGVQLRYGPSGVDLRQPGSCSRGRH